jgi:hypothetical protein
MRLFKLIILLVFVFSASAVWAQTAIQAEMNAIGQGLEDDSKGVYDRLVYDDAQTVDKKVSLALPVLPNQDIQDWLSDHIAQILTVTPTRYPLHIKEMPRYFTTGGWQQLQTQWNEAGIPHLILENNYRMTALVVQASQIVAKGRLKNVYRWIVDVPVLLTYVPPQGAEPQAFNLTLRIGLTRIPMQDDARLIAIDEWAIAPKPAPAVEAKPANPAY